MVVVNVSASKSLKSACKDDSLFTSKRKAEQREGSGFRLQGLAQSRRLLASLNRANGGVDEVFCGIINRWQDARLAALCSRAELLTARQAYSPRRSRKSPLKLRLTPVGRNECTVSTSQSWWTSTEENSNVSQRVHTLVFFIIRKQCEITEKKKSGSFCFFSIFEKTCTNTFTFTQHCYSENVSIVTCAYVPFREQDCAWVYVVTFCVAWFADNSSTLAKRLTRWPNASITCTYTARGKGSAETTHLHMQICKTQWCSAATIVVPNVNCRYAHITPLVSFTREQVQCETVTCNKFSVTTGRNYTNFEVSKEENCACMTLNLKVCSGAPC